MPSTPAIPPDLVSQWFTRGFDPSHKHLLLTVSGGADSMALLAYFKQITLSAAPCRLSVVHIDHHLRPESHLDADFVKSECAAFNTACTVVHLDPTQKGKRESVEAWARRERYAAFTQVAAKCQADCILTAHHREDLLETVLLRLLRGEGWRAWAGMPFMRDPGIVRPFLTLPGSVLRAYLQTTGQAWREDGSNGDRRFLRNHLRLDVLPKLDAEWPGWRDKLTDLIFVIQKMLPFIESLEAGPAPAMIEANRYAVSADCMDQPMAEGDSVLLLERLRGLLTAAGGPAGKPNRPFLRGFRPGMAQNSWSIAKGWRLNRRVAVLANRKPVGSFAAEVDGEASAVYEVCKEQPIESLVENQATVTSVHLDLSQLPGAWDFSLGGQKYRLQARSLLRQEMGAFPAEREGRAIFNATRISSTLNIRTRQAGDRFCPLGLSGHSRKLKSVLRDKGVSLEARDSLPLVFSHDHLAWVPGIGLADWAKVEPDSDNLLELVLEWLKPTTL